MGAGVFPRTPYAKKVPDLLRSQELWWTVTYQIRTIQIGELNNSGSAFVVERHNNLIIKGKDRIYKGINQPLTFIFIMSIDFAELVQEKDNLSASQNRMIDLLLQNPFIQFIFLRL